MPAERPQEKDWRATARKTLVWSRIAWIELRYTALVSTRVARQLVGGDGEKIVITPREALAFGGLPTLWLLVLVLQTTPHGSAGLRAFLIVLVAGLIVWSLYVTEDRHGLGVVRGRKALDWICLAGGGLQLVYCLIKLIHPALGNIATTTIAAARVIASGGNPYTHPVDPLFAGPMLTEGYKFLPVTAAAYLPLGALLGERGLLLTNILLQLGVAAAVIELASRDSEHRSEGLVAAALYLSLPLVAVQIFSEGTIDLVPVLLLLVAILLSEQREFFGGVAAGLSCSAAVFPGVVGLPACIPGTERGRELFLFGFAAGLAPSLVFFAAAPAAFLANPLGLDTAHALIAPSEATDMSDWALGLGQTLVCLLWVGLVVMAWRRQLPIEARCGLAALLMLAVLLVSASVRLGEHLWWLPLAVIAIGRPAALELTRRHENEAFRDSVLVAEGDSGDRLSGLAGRGGPEASDHA